MSNLVPADQIEQIVGVERHSTRHFARAVSAEQIVYILHSAKCRDSGRDLRECLFSVALDNGVRESDWAGHEEQPIRVSIDAEQRLIPVVPGMRIPPGQPTQPPAGDAR
jgi:hypothetical protein